MYHIKQQPEISSPLVHVTRDLESVPRTESEDLSLPHLEKKYISVASVALGAA